MPKVKKKFLKLSYILVGVTLVFILLGATYGRYIYNEIKDYYLSTKNFYFNSDKLTTNRAIYQVENWSGVDNYQISINLNSFKNNFEICDSNVTYQVTYACSGNVNCSLNKTSGTISTVTNTDNLVALLSPIGNLSEGDSAFIEVTAESTSPYNKTISARFILNVATIGLSYQIDDQIDSPYFNLNITNTIDYYTVITPFGNYSANDKIDINTYLALSNVDKLNCKSALITLIFDPNIAVLDMTSNAYLNATNYTTTTINGHEYINSVTFNIDAISSYVVKFYKVDASQNYTYPFTNPSSIINFSYI